MADVEQVKQQIETAKQLASQKRAEAQAIQQRLRQQERSLPDVESQEALRTKYAGIEARQFREKVGEVSKELGQRQEAVERYQEGISEYESGLETSRQQISKEQAEWDQAKELIIQRKEWAVPAGSPLRDKINYLVRSGLEAPKGVEHTGVYQSADTGQLYSAAFPQSERDIEVVVKEGRVEYPIAYETPSGDRYSSAYAQSIFDKPIVVTPQGEEYKLGELERAQLYHTQSYKLPPAKISGAPKKEITDIPAMVRSVSTKLGEATLSVGERIAKPIERILPKTSIIQPAKTKESFNILRTRAVGGLLRTEIPRETAKDIVGGVYLFSAFAPVVTTSTTIRSGLAATQKTPTAIQKLEQTPLQIKGFQVKADNKVFDVGYGMKKTPEYSLFVEYGQKSIISPKGYVSAGTGRSIVLSKEGKLVGETFKGVQRGVKVSKVYYEGKAIKGFKGTAAEVYIKPSLKITGKIEKGITFPTGRGYGKIMAKVTPSKESMAKDLFIGVGKQRKEFIDFFGTKAKKIVSFRTKQPTYDIKYAQGEVDIFGTIKRIQPTKTKESFGILRTKKVTGFTGGVLQTQAKRIESILKTEVIPTTSTKGINLMGGFGSLVRTGTKEVQLTKPQSILSIKSTTKIVPIVKTKQKAIEIVKPKTEHKSILNIKTTLLNKLDVQSRVIQAQRLKQTQKLNQEQRQSLRSLLSIRSQSPLKQRTTKTSKVRPFPIVTTSYSTKGGKVVKAGKERYVVMVKRYGSDIIIGESRTLTGAKKILTNALKGTLAVSGFVISKETRKKQSLKDLFGNIFRPAKREPFRLVQRRGKRLSSMGEVFDIQAARKGNRKRTKRRKTKKVNWWG